ncbi:MAG: JmjC domain-containing protein [Burkholderiaceae bacterium]
MTKEDLRDPSGAEAASLFPAILTFLKASLANQEQVFQLAPGLLPENALFSIERLETLLANPLLSPEWLQVSLKGQVVPVADDQMWKTVQKKRLQFIDKRRLVQALEQGASVVLEGLDLQDQTINALVRQIDQLMPCALSNCEAFFSRQSNEAYGGHRDSDDVLVIQVSGQKRWRVHQPQRRRYHGNSPLTEQQMGPVLKEFVMNPGDVLYLRAGVPHRCTTPGSHSLHLSFDLCDRTPNIEQISAAGMSLYNQGAADCHAEPAAVVRRYVELVSDPGFIRELESARVNIRREATAFRDRIHAAGLRPRLKP